MATEKTDVVIVGVGAAGGILAAELGKAGMKVIGLERGPRLKTKDFAGWRLVGFPGAHPAFTPADMASKEAFAGGVLIGLQGQAPVKRS